MTFVFVTSIAGTPLFTTNGHVFKVLRKRAPKTCPKAPSGSTLTSGQPVLSRFPLNTGSTVFLLLILYEHQAKHTCPSPVCAPRVPLSGGSTA